MAELFWLSTVRDGGHPHVTPLPAIWYEDRLHFFEHRSESACRADDRYNHWKEGLDLVVEGNAVRVTDDSRLRTLADLWRSKYLDDWDFTVEDGMFHHDGGDAIVFEVAAVKVLAFAKGVFAQTRYRFE